MIGTAASTSAASAATPKSSNAKRSIVLVHGAYADGSCWSDVIQELQATGVTVTSVQNPLTSLNDDVAATRRILDMQAGPTVLVAHSYGGTVITQAGDHPKVDSLVYLSARAPEAGEDYPALAAKFPTPPANAGLVYTNGFGGLTEKAFLDDFANGVPRARALVLHGRGLTGVTSDGSAAAARPAPTTSPEQDSQPRVGGAVRHRWRPMRTRRTHCETSSKSANG